MTGVIHLSAQKCQGFPENARSTQEGFFQSHQREQPNQHLDFGLLTSRTETINFCLFKKFIYLWLAGSLSLCKSFLQSQGVWELSSRGTRASHYGDFSCCGARALELTGFSSCSSWAWLPHGMWYLSSRTKDRTPVPDTGGWILNLWTTREVSISVFFCQLFLLAGS